MRSLRMEIQIYREDNERRLRASVSSQYGCERCVSQRKVHKISAWCARRSTVRNSKDSVKGREVDKESAW